MPSCQIRAAVGGDAVDGGVGPVEPVLGESGDGVMEVLLVIWGHPYFHTALGDPALVGLDDLTSTADVLVRGLHCLEERGEIVCSHPQTTEQIDHLLLIQHDPVGVLGYPREQCMSLGRLLLLVLACDE